MKKTKIFMTETEWRFVIHSLNALRTKLHNEKQYTDAVDDAMLKVMTAPIKRVKIKQSSRNIIGAGDAI